MNFPHTLDEWLAWQEAIHPTTIDMSLERIRAVALRVGIPQNISSVVITVAGTNGKGSTVAFFESVLTAAGYRVGSYTSPHILRYNERVRVLGEEVSDAALCAAFAQVEQARGDVSLTYFEYGTLAALLILQQAELDVMVLEVGLGGRLDAVNIVDPDLAVVTTVDLDHMEWLGEDRELIGREKAGIFRQGVPAVCGDAHPPQSLLAYAEQVGAPFYVQGRDFHVERQNGAWCWRGGVTPRVGLPAPFLKGDFQYLNAASVLMGLELLKDRLPVTQDHIRQGLMNVRLTGRFQVLSSQPLVIVDVAHNPQSARSLVQTLATQPIQGKTYAVFSMLRDKDIEAVLAILQPVIDEWHIAGLESEPRGLTLLQMLQRIERAGMDLAHFTGHEDLTQAFQHVVEQAAAQDRVVVFGSFFVVAEILKRRIIN